MIRGLFYLPALQVSRKIDIETKRAEDYGETCVRKYSYRIRKGT
jgi:hypothetical protein